MNTMELKNFFREQDSQTVEKELKRAHRLADAVKIQMDNGDIEEAFKGDVELKKSLENLMALYNLKENEVENKRRNYF